MQRYFAGEFWKSEGGIFILYTDHFAKIEKYLREFATTLAEKDKEIAELKAENNQLEGLFLDLDDPENAQVLWKGKYLIQRVVDHDAELKRYYEARDTIAEKDKEIAELKSQLVRGFYEDEKPKFYQGELTHELESLVTSEEVNNYIDKIAELTTALQVISRKEDKEIAKLKAEKPLGLGPVSLEGNITQN